MFEVIAIPSAGPVLNAHFGRSEEFSVFEVSNGNVRQLESISMRGYEHQHAGIAQLLKRQGVNKVICGGIGGGMVSGLEAAGIEVISGASGYTADIAQAYAQGTLEATGDSCHEHEHHYQGHQ